MYARKVAEQYLTFIVSGRLWRNSLVMQDEETQTYWSHVTGRALLGKLKDIQLSALPAVQTTWKEWYRAHPNTRLLKKNRVVWSSAYEDYFRNPRKTGLFRSHWLKERLPGKKLIYGIAYQGHELAITEDTLEKKTLLLVRLGDQPVSVIKNQDGGVRAFLSKFSGNELTFYLDEKSGRFFDRETHSLWDLYTGSCLDGQYEGKKLKELQVYVAFWFAWSTFYPNTKVLD